MIKRLRGKENLINLGLILAGLFGLYLIVAWASYSPLDNAWSVGSTLGDKAVINKTGAIGAWLIDLLYTFFGKVAFFIPFALTGVSAYLLILRQASELTLKSIWLHIASFLVMMLGLSGLASVLLSNSPNYLAGGFVGGLWQTILGESFGQFVAVLCAMLCTAVGFYFCSGQAIIPLLTSFYEWVTAKNTPQPSEMTSSISPMQAVENPEFLQTKAEIEPLVNESETASVKVENRLTDVTHFKRPNISGLHSEEMPLQREVAQDTQAESTMFKVESELNLPKVNVQGFEPNSLSLQTEQSPEMPSEDYTAPTEMPTVRLNPFSTEKPMPATPVAESVQAEHSFEVSLNPDHEVEVAVIEPTVEPPAFAQASKPPVVRIQPTPEMAESENVGEDFSTDLARQFEEAEKARLAEMEARSKAQGLEQTLDAILQTPDEIRPLETANSATLKVKLPETTAEREESSAPNYPKGYGDSLIHPLLQKNKITEKPTTPLPTLDLLDVRPANAQRLTEDEIFETSKQVENALANYGVKATVEDVLVGPVVTRYEIKPAAGVKAAKVTALASDLARELMFKAIRITEVVPGKPYMGIETPNPVRQTVWLRDVLDSPAFRNSDAKLPMALGKDISGQPVVVDMAKMPHLLVAGQTGGGKSVGVNTMILSLLFKLTPEQVRFIMIDPKVVELSIYNDIPHLLTPVVTDMKKAANALRWAVEEMERRYLLVSHLQVRNIEGYNAKIDQASEMNMPIPDPTWRPRDSMDSLPPPLEKLSYIVLIVDEFADLMMTAGKEVEEHIMRIAQKARAVGIHLILATQRPSTDVITGVIKANIPSRIAFTVASQIDSRTILDAGGAESLLGRGDMLYSGAGSPDILRVHGAFMDDDEVARVADNWRARGKPNYLESIVASVEETDGSARADGGVGDLDPRFDEIVEFVVESGITSISGIQRRFGLGFNRAGRIIDQMEAQGIISEPGKGGKREILAR